MRIRAVLHPNSMPLTVHHCLHVTYALLLLCSSTSCLDIQTEHCPWINTCGDFWFIFPFGKITSGCGDPEFQLDCDINDNQVGHSPLININGNEYRILKPFFLSDYSNPKSMFIVDDNLRGCLWGAKCNVSGNYSQFWLSDSHFHIVPGYTNLTLWGQCENNNDEWPHPPLCGNDWYYNLRPDEGARFCKTNFQIPIKNEDLHELYEFNNNLTYFLGNGFEIEWQVDYSRSLSCKDCWTTNGTCGYDISESTTILCYCPDGTSHTDKCPTPHGRKSKYAIVIGCSVGGVALLAIALVLFLTYCAGRRKLSPGQGPAKDFVKYERKDKEAYVPRLKIGNLSIFSYEELRQATNCFHEENELGDGGFGSVYLGKLWDRQMVAVKRLYQDNSRRLGQFINEVAIFSTLNHPRVVRLCGCTSADSPELLLVYEFVSNGTLADHLHGERRNPRGLPWDTRLNIAIQTAEALTFLHSVDPPIFHRDVKTSNILLDENFNVKVADFGLSRHMPVNASHVTTTPQGTPGYVDPEYHQYYQLTEKSDVYSFGVVLVEIISAKLAVDVNRNTREINLASMAISKIQEGALHELVDPHLEMEMNPKVKAAISPVAELAFRCLASESDDRPHMKEVVAQLEVIRELWGVCPSPLEQLASLPTHNHWRSFPSSVQGKRPSMRSAPNASA